MFFWSVFGRFLTRFWLVVCVNFTCFSHTCSNCVFAYFFLGRFSTLCTLSKHGIFKTHCFSVVKTLFWRNRLCRRNLRILILGGGIVPCFLLNFQVFWRVFRHSFSHRFLDAFLIKNMFKLTPKDVGAPPPFSTFFEVAIFGRISRLPAAIVPPPGLGKIISMRKICKKFDDRSMQVYFLQNTALKN